MIKLIPKHQKGKMLKHVKDLMNDTKKQIGHAVKAVEKTGDFLSDEEIEAMYDLNKVINTQNKTKINMADFYDYSRLPRFRQSFDGMNSINRFLDEYMQMYPTQTYSDWLRTGVKMAPDGYVYAPGLNLRRAEAIRNQMYYDLLQTDPKTRFYGGDASHYSPEYIQQLKDQANQLNEIYKDLLNRQTLINYMNGQPTFRSTLAEPDLFKKAIK